MIRTATQLKVKVKNLSGGDSSKSQTLIRNFIMERFLERISLSRYRSNFILKGGMLVSAVVGLDTRATMDMISMLSAGRKHIIRQFSRKRFLPQAVSAIPRSRFRILETSWQLLKPIKLCEDSGTTMRRIPSSSAI